MKKVPKILIYSSILVLAIYLFISITREYAAHKYLSDYKSSLKDKIRDRKYQESLLKMSLKYSSSNAETFFALGRLGQIGKSSEERGKSQTMSKEYLLEGLTRKPTDGRNRAVYAWYTGDKTNHAIKHFNIAMNLSPTDAYIHKLYALWCMNRVKREIDVTDTVQLLEQYSKWQDKDDPLNAYGDRYINGTSISELLNTSQAAWDKVQSLVSPRRWDRDHAAHKSLADLKFLTFDLDRAIEYYKQVDNKLMLARCNIIKNAPGKAINILGSVIKEGGTLYRRNLAEIKKLLMISLDYDPENYQSFYWLGEIHTRLGKTENAIGNFKTAVLLNPKHIDSHLNLAKLYKQNGKVDLAIKEYETILGQAPYHKEAARLLNEAITLKYKDAQ